MKKIIRKNNQHYDIWLQWNLTSQCNFNCDYCFGKTSPDKRTINFIDSEKILQTLEKDGRIFRIGFTGGEPFLIPNFVDACKELTKKHFISLNSNLIPDQTNNFTNSIDPKRVLNIHASVHFEELISKELLDRFITNYTKFFKNGFNIYAEAVAYPDIISKVDQYNSYMENNKVEFRFAPFFGEYNNKFYPGDYTEVEIKAFNLDKNDLNNHYQKGSVCNAGYNAAVISPKGKISPCFNVSGNLGHIYKEISTSDNLTICPASKCVCPLNYYDSYLLNKAKNLTEQTH